MPGARPKPALRMLRPPRQSRSASPSSFRLLPFPIALVPGQNTFAMVSLITATGGAPKPSRLSKKRPSNQFAPMRFEKAVTHTLIKGHISVSVPPRGEHSFQSACRCRLQCAPAEARPRGSPKRLRHDLKPIVQPASRTAGGVRDVKNLACRRKPCGEQMIGTNACVNLLQTPECADEETRTDEQDQCQRNLETHKGGAEAIVAQ